MMGANRRGAGHRSVAPLRPPSFSVSAAAQRSAAAGRGGLLFPLSQQTLWKYILLRHLRLTLLLINVRLIFYAAELARATKTKYMREIPHFW